MDQQTLRILNFPSAQLYSELTWHISRKKLFEFTFLNCKNSKELLESDVQSCNQFAFLLFAQDFNQIMSTAEWIICFRGNSAYIPTRMRLKWSRKIRNLHLNLNLLSILIYLLKSWNFALKLFPGKVVSTNDWSKI